MTQAVHTQCEQCNFACLAVSSRAGAMFMCVYVLSGVQAHSVWERAGADVTSAYSRASESSSIRYRPLLENQAPAWGTHLSLRV